MVVEASWYFQVFSLLRFKFLHDILLKQRLTTVKYVSVMSFTPEDNTIWTWHKGGEKLKTPSSKWEWFGRPHFDLIWAVFPLFIYIDWNLETISISDTLHNFLYSLKLTKEATKCMDCSETQTPLLESQRVKTKLSGDLKPALGHIFTN